MKKIVTVFLLGIFNLSYAQQHVSKPNTKSAALTGNVKSVLEKSVTLLTDGGRYESRHIYTEYNKEGNMVLYKFIYDVKKNNYSQNLYKYNSVQNLIEVDMYKDSVLVEKRLYEYDPKNRMTKETMYNGKGYMTQKSLFFYNIAGHMVEMQLWSSETYMALKEICTYDKNGNKKSLKTYDDRNVFAFGYDYNYDEKNNKTRQIYKRSNNPVIQKTENTYNEKNKLVRSLTYDNDKLVNETVYSYNKNDSIKTESTMLNPSRKSKYISRLNEKGLLVETLDYKSDKLDVRQTYWYEYDATGNWTKTYNSYNGGSPTLLERELQYY